VKAIRALIAVAVIAVAIVAGTVSYSHLLWLAQTSGGMHGFNAHIMPVSIDGLLCVASLVMVIQSLDTGKSSWLPRVGVIAGIAGTLAANASFGWRNGWPGVIVSAWPALAFVLSTEIALSMFRHRSRVPMPSADAVTAVIVPDGSAAMDAPDGLAALGGPPDVAPGPPGVAPALLAAASKADAVRVAVRELGDTAPAATIAAWLGDRGHVISAAHVRQVRSGDRRAAVTASTAVLASSAPRTVEGVNV
jgi:hypothetical protein